MHQGAWQWQTNLQLLHKLQRTRQLQASWCKPRLYFSILQEPGSPGGMSGARSTQGRSPRSSGSCASVYIAITAEPLTVISRPCAPLRLKYLQAQGAVRARDVGSCWQYNVLQVCSRCCSRPPPRMQAARACAAGACGRKNAPLYTPTRTCGCRRGSSRAPLSPSSHATSHSAPAAPTPRAACPRRS